MVEDGRKKLNTLAHYKVPNLTQPPYHLSSKLRPLTSSPFLCQIPEGASLAMSLTDKKDNSLGRGMACS